MNEHAEILDQLIVWYCRKQGIPEPVDRASTEKLLNRMKNMGMIKDEECKKYLENIHDKNSAYL